MGKLKWFRWTRKHRRCYSRIRHGLQQHKGQRLRFLTLSTAPNMVVDLMKGFNTLNKRIYRLTVNELIFNGYMTRSKASYYYHGLDYDAPLQFDYLAVRTSEGVAGVVHLLYFGEYIPQKWLSDNWLDITGSSSIVDIRATFQGIHDAHFLARYCVSQYTAGQDKFKHYSASHGWSVQGITRLQRAFNSVIGAKEGRRLVDFLLYYGFLPLASGYVIKIYKNRLNISNHPYYKDSPRVAIARFMGVDLPDWVLMADGSVQVRVSHLPNNHPMVQEVRLYG